MRGKLFGPAHMREVWRFFCASEVQLAWVMCPGDPNQVDDELVWYLFALVVSAILALWEELAENGQPIEGVSAIEVDEFISSRQINIIECIDCYGFRSGR